MAVFDTRGLFRRCPNCDTAVADDAVDCPSCGESLAAASREPGGRTRAVGDEADEDEDHDRPRRRRAPPPSGTVFGGAGGLFGLGEGTSGFAAAVTGFFAGLIQSLGEAAVKLLGLKTGASALDDNPWRRETAGLAELVRRRVYRVTFPWRTGLRETSLVPFYRSLASYSEAGVGFHDALSRIEKNELSPALQRIIREIRASLLDGDTLGEAFGRHEYLFDPLHVALIEVGESLGTVSDNMKVLVEIIEEKQRLRDAVAKKLVQPVMLIILANYVMTLPVFMVGGLFAYLRTIFLPTAFFAFAIFSFVFLFPVFFAAIGPRVKDRVLLELPAFGTIARTTALARFSRALGSAIGAGVEMEKSLRMAARATGNLVVEDAVIDALPFVKERGLAEGLQAGGVLPPAIAAVLAHGEASGKMAPTLLQISKDASERAARGITVLGGILAFFVLAVSAVYAVLKSMTTVLGMLGGGGIGRPGVPSFDPFNDPRLPPRG